MLRSVRRPGLFGSFVRVALVALVVLILAVLGVIAYWTLGAYGPDARAESAFERSEDMGGWYEFGEGDVGVVLYPGARVDAEAYAPTAKRLSEESDVLVAVVRVPLDVALLDNDAAEEVFQAHPGVEGWIVAGHSLGGVAASSFADDNPEVDGLLLWASYPAGGTDLSDDDIEVASIYGSRDEVLEIRSLEEAKPRLPVSTEYVEIQGMNHAQFGSYGAQDGDGRAETPAIKATREISDASARLVGRT